MDQIAVSVIIPVYNGEAYLRQCLDSVRAQTLENIEIICVDDLSTDSSQQILEEYQATDPRFRLLRHAENQGVSAARNSGLAITQGEYVIFWDCDDFFEPNALELLEGQARQTNADICVCGADRYFSNMEKRFPFTYLDTKLIPKDAETFNRVTNPKYILNFTPVAPWNKLLRRSFLEKHELTMPPFRFAEDAYFSILALCLAERIATVKDVLVHYRFNSPTSLVGQSQKNSKIFFPPWLAIAERLRALGILPEDSFGWAAIGTAIYALRLSATREVFLDTARFLHEHGVLEKLCIAEREPEYYKSPRQEQHAKHLIHDEPEDLLAFLMHDTYLELREVTANRNELRASRDKLKKRLAKDKETHERELALLTDEKALLETMNQSLGEENGQLRQALEALNVEYSRQAVALKALTEETHHLQAVVDSLTQEKQRLQDDVSRLTRQKQDLQAESAALSEDKRRLQAEAASLTEDRRRLQAEVESLTDRIARLQADNQSLTEANQQLAAQKDTLSARLSKTKKQLKATEQSLQEVLGSRTFRLGKAMLYVPQKIAAPFRKK